MRGETRPGGLWPAAGAGSPDKSAVTSVNHIAITEPENWLLMSINAAI
jgi:hypothetical protein